MKMTLIVHLFMVCQAVNQHGVKHFKYIKYHYDFIFDSFPQNMMLNSPVITFLLAG